MIYDGLVNSLENRPPLRYHHRWRGGRVVEGAPLLREYAVLPRGIPHQLAAEINRKKAMFSVPHKANTVLI